MKNVGFIGLGTMGRALAANLAAAGHNVIVYDVREEPVKGLADLGAKAARSVSEVGAQSEIVEIAVVDDAQVEQVVLGEGLLDAMQAGTVIVIHSTIHPKTVRKVGLEASRKRVGVLDAQMSGGGVGARSKTLCFMVGGDKVHFDQCHAVLAVSGQHIFHVGALGMGAAAKLAQQSLICLNRLAAYEGMVLADQAGVDMEVFRQIVHLTSAQSHIADHYEQYGKMEGLAPEEARWLAHLFYKGLCPALELAHELGLSVPGVALVQQRFEWVLGIKKD
jgi:3-hydroxyisobutyrate dehydrogenase